MPGRCLRVDISPDDKWQVLNVNFIYYAYAIARMSLMDEDSLHLAAFEAESQPTTLHAPVAPNHPCKRNTRATKRPTIDTQKPKIGARNWAFETRVPSGLSTPFSSGDFGGFREPISEHDLPRFGPRFSLPFPLQKPCQTPEPGFGIGFRCGFLTRFLHRISGRFWASQRLFSR